ncbi:MAG: Glycosyltransferase [Candidatus Peribacter riflensis]|uniref:Glycosyltransferase n=1 Tax=Candidatus Peribacter riflensis TaxID=1735162 RepID=A0A0S1SHR5_9BACT|nr:MAG: Glycosyltransferase [Candidatus Peribacter riflensis]ALM11355.1 MAG: hypothetical protein PeribacterB2_0892 [Candidatus Peribacter riflensis]ALM12457.1 MAG: hypothetical protein PeribacterC2_0891 [Candidatus Peribacter riflensis]ALM13558.1 MAG: Glycosyltransferase [Candidatus Peribacter riflensis]ALM14659.1 MAG: hypothetical protein PeribacterD2_0890 [Candidatus Peribacter riflensis]
MKTLRIILYIFITGCLLFTFVNGVLMRLTI